MQWRVDVTISSTALARVFRPSILVQLALSPLSSRIATLHLSVDSFHRLRYEVARALKHVQELEQHPTLRKE